MPEGRLGVTLWLGSGEIRKPRPGGKRTRAHSEQVTGGAGTPSTATRMATRRNHDVCRSLAQRG